MAIAQCCAKRNQHNLGSWSNQSPSRHANQSWLCNCNCKLIRKLELGLWIITFILKQDMMLCFVRANSQKTNQMRVASWGILYAHLPTPCLHDLTTVFLHCQYTADAVLHATWHFVSRPINHDVMRVWHVRLLEVALLKDSFDASIRCPSKSMMGYVLLVVLS